MASRKPIFSNALFHSRMPSSTNGRNSWGTVSSTYQMICRFGGESFAFGLDFSSRQRLTMRTAFESGSLDPKSLIVLRKKPTRSSACRLW